MGSPIDLDFNGQVGSAPLTDDFPPPTSGVYSGTFQTLFGGLSSQDQQKIWSYFLFKNNLTDPPPTDPDTQAIFNQYVVRVVEFYDPARYGTLFQPLFGDMSVEDQLEVWNYFLYKNNLPNPPPTNQETKDIFSKHAVSVYKYLQLKILDGDNLYITVPLLQPPTSGFYATTFQSYFGGLTPQEQQRVWVQFLADNDLTTTPPANDGITQARFIQYASSVYGLDPSVTYDFAILEPPTTGFFANAFQSYFGGLSPLQQKKIWIQFLLNNKFAVTGPPENDAAMQLFMAYANAVLSVIQSQNVHSPEEVRKRYIMSQTIEALLRMLASLQDAIGVQSRNLIFYGFWQQEYTKMMARVPTYVGDPDMGVKVPSPLDVASLEKFTFGYNKLSVADLAEWWAANSLEQDGQAFTMTGLAKDAFGNPLLSVSFIPQVGATPGVITWTTRPPPFGAPVTNTVPVPLQSDLLSFQENSAQSKRSLAQEAYATAFKNAFISAWNGGLSASVASVNDLNKGAINAINPSVGRATTDIQPRSKPDTSANSSLEIPWGFSYVVGPSGHSDASGNVTVAGKLSDDNAKARGEINAKLQTFIDSIRARRKTVQTTAQRLQADLDQSRQTVTRQSDILNSILQSITDLVKGIFRK